MDNPIFTDVMSLRRFGWNALAAGDVAAACDALALAALRDAENPEAWLVLGLARARAKLWKPAVLALERACALDPDGLTAWCALAEVGLAENDFASAVKALKEAVRIDPDCKTPQGTRARMLAVKAWKRLKAT